MSTFTETEKLEAIRREIKYRRRVYAKRVAEGTMFKATHDYQIAIFEAIEADYVQRAEKERLL